MDIRTLQTRKTILLTWSEGLGTKVFDYEEDAFDFIKEHGIDNATIIEQRIIHVGGYISE